MCVYIYTTIYCQNKKRVGSTDHYDSKMDFGCSVSVMVKIDDQCHSIISY